MDGTLHSNDPYTSPNVSYLSVRKDGGSTEQVNESNSNHVLKSKVVCLFPAN